jgi:hypothetical protein
MKISFVDKHGWTDEHGVEHIESVTTGEGEITIVGKSKIFGGKYGARREAYRRKRSNRGTSCS